MIYDCFCYFNEVEILDLRINYLKDVVDKFVIIEANKTNVGQSKPKNFDIEQYKSIQDKIIYIFLEDMPENNYNNSWFYENYQRNYIFEVLKKENCKNDDIIIISDLDEIPSKSAIEAYKTNPNGIKSLSQKFYNLYLNLFNQNETPWNKAKIMTYKEFFNEKNNIQHYQMCLLKEINQEITPTKIRFINSCEIIPNGGWHFSYIGNADMIINKIKNFAHQEFNNDFYTDKTRIENCLKNCTDILNRNQTYQKVKIDNTFPDYLVENINKFKDFII